MTTLREKIGALRLRISGAESPRDVAALQAELSGLEQSARATATDGEARLDAVPLPTHAERALMQALAITFDDGVFRWREFRYERLADAVAFATRESGRKPGRA